MAGFWMKSTGCPPVSTESIFREGENSKSRVRWPPLRTRISRSAEACRWVGGSTDARIRKLEMETSLTRGTDGEAPLGAGGRNEVQMSKKSTPSFTCAFPAHKGSEIAASQKTSNPPS